MSRDEFRGKCNAIRDRAVLTFAQKKPHWRPKRIHQDEAVEDLAAGSAAAAGISTFTSEGSTFVRS